MRPRRPSAASSCAVVYYDLARSEGRTSAQEVALIRVEQLYPFPTETVAAVLARYPRIRRVMDPGGAAEHGGSEVRPAQDPLDRRPTNSLGDVSRPERSRPAEGYPAAHAAEQARIVRDAFAA